MSYGKRYFFTFNAVATGLVADQGDQYTCEIHKLDYSGEADQILAQRNPVTLDYSNSTKNKLEPLRASKAVTRLIANDSITLADLYSEDERTWLQKVYRRPYKSTYRIDWSLDESPGGFFVDTNLFISVNGVLVVEAFATGSAGYIDINAGDSVHISTFSYFDTTGINGVELAVTGKPVLRSVTYPHYLEQVFTPDSDLTVSAYSTHSETDYKAIRSAVFEPTCTTGTPSKVTFTKSYTSAVDQASADALAAADTGFDSEGQAYAETNGICETDQLLWKGFILPELCDEEFSFAPYPLEVNAVDGLGILKNLSFVQEDGLHFTGKMSFKDVIWNCLNRLQIPDMILNTSVNLYYEGLTPADSTDPLAETFISTERYFKDEDLTPMTCEEVLKSVLEEWTACIVQMNGHWYVYRPNELAMSGSIVFRQYSPADGSSIGTDTIQMNNVLGGDSEGSLIYHVDRAQRKSIAKPFKNATISYKYGFLRSVLANPNFDNATTASPLGDPEGPRTDVIIPGWSTVLGIMNLGIASGGGIIFYAETPFDPLDFLKNDETIFIGANKRLRVAINYSLIPSAFFPVFYMNVVLTTTTTTLYLQNDFTWGPAQPFYTTLDASGLYDITSDLTPDEGTIEFRLYMPEEADFIINSVTVTIDQQNLIEVGEIHKAEQTGKYSFVPEILNVFNGDGDTDLYNGAILQNDEDTPAENWIRRGLSESPLSTPDESAKPFLRIAVEEILRLHSRPMNVYDGTVAGYFQYLTRFQINDLPGIFLPVQLSYDLQESTINATLAEVSNDEIENSYEMLPDYGSVTKVSINGI